MDRRRARHLGDVERLQHLTDGLLLLARLDAQQHRPHQAVDLADITAEATGAIRRADVTIETTGLDTPAHVRGDPEQLRRMMRNLVHNAEVHADTRISVSVASDGRATHICVSDDGPGIPPDDRVRVFERFMRLDTARTRDTGGTGLGLAIVHDVVASHHGTITVTDSELGGAAFTIELPRSRLSQRVVQPPERDRRNVSISE